MSVKFSTKEPSERVSKVALSVAEISILSNHHLACAKKVPLLLGKELMGKIPKGGLPPARMRQILIDHAKEIAMAHINRAKELQEILKGGTA
jgi:hypothetical protein